MATPKQPPQPARPHQPPPNDVERCLRFTPEQLRAYRQWRHVRAIQKYWRERERELRPPDLVLIAGPTIRLMRWFLWLLDELARAYRRRQ